jgi:hypothetical protein
VTQILPNFLTARSINSIVKQGKQNVNKPINGKIAKVNISYLSTVVEVEGTSSFPIQ